jgi:hypothetical protein
MNPLLAGQVSEVEKILSSFKCVIKMSDHVLRVPLYLKGREVPLLVIEFDVDQPYPHHVPGIRIVTKADLIDADDAAYLVQWLESQAETRLGRPMLAGLVALAQTWAEILHDNHLAKQEAEKKEQKRRKDEEKARQDALDEQRKRQEAEDRRRQEEADDPEQSEEDSGEERRRRVAKFEVAAGFVPRLSSFCIKCFGDNLLLFDEEGFDDIPVQIRAKIFVYLLETKSLSHRKLAMLVGHDQRRLNLSGCGSYLKDHYLAVLERTRDLNFLDLSGCGHLTSVGFNMIAACNRITVRNMCLCVFVACLDKMCFCRS